MKNDRTIEFSLHTSRGPAYSDVGRLTLTYSDVFKRIQTYSDVCRRTVAFNESLHLGVRKSLPYGRAQRLTRPKCAILGKITRHINFFLIVFTERNATKNEGIIEGSLHMKVKKWSLTPFPPSQCVENLSADRSINSIISIGSNIDPRGGGDFKSPQNGHFFSFLVPGRVRKCVELFYRNWPGLTLSSPKHRCV